MAKEKIFAVFGLGSFGWEVCKVLSEKGGKVIAIDTSAKLVEKIKDLVAQAVVMDSTDEEALKSLSIQDIDVAIVGIGDNMEASILTTAILKKLGVPYILARAVSELHAQVLRLVGATEIINIEIEEGRQTATRLISPDILDRIPISKNQVLAEILIPKTFVNKNLQQLDLRRKFNITVISIKRDYTSIDDMGNPVKEEIVLAPKPEETLREKDVLVVVSDDKGIEQLKGM